MHGFAAIEKVKSKHMVWNEFTNIIGIINVRVREDFTEHLLHLEKNQDQDNTKTTGTTTRPM